ncbi:helix-hairpin-helix domain-containing protein [Deinococcus altitudinis]|uniref:ComEA family DNA-binding protein n=1 Tax=Deinococcus altitudinis TaxID=468914 RepID=UPI0038926E9D
MRTYTAILTALIVFTAPALAQTTPAKPAATMPAPSMPAKPATTMPMPAMSKLAVNTATEAQLASVPGVGPKLAAAIVKARPFKNSADLIKKVKGIGPKNYLKLGLDKTFTY